MKTKKLIVGIGLALLGSFAHAQNGLENVTVEPYYISNAADAAQADADIDQYNADNGTSLPHGALPVGSVTYRFYADMLPGYQLLAVYADVTKSQSLVFTTTTSFYNNPNGSESPVPGTLKSAIKNNLLALDTYYSLGAVATNNSGILKSEDPGGSGTNAINVTVAGNPSGVLLNNDVAAGISLTTADGMVATAGYQAPATAGFAASHSDFFNNGSVISNSFVLADGSWGNPAGAVGPIAATNRVLIAQFTTNGHFHYEFNILLKSPAGAGETYATHPTGSDLTAPGITGDLGPNTPPSVSITSPVPAANLVLGAPVVVDATASDADGTVASVQFFVDGVSIGTDNSAPYEATWASATPLGTHTLTATATDNGGAQTSANNVVTVVSNPPPVVNITLPTHDTTVIVPDVVNIAANATDNGSVAQVEFFIDNVSIGIDNTAPYTTTWVSTLGIHHLTAKATDNLGAIGTTSTSVTLNCLANMAPLVSVSVTPTSMFAPATFNVSATAIDNDGSVASVEFFDGATSIGVDNTAPYSVVLNTSVIGAHSITAVATDNRGLTNTSSAVTATVLDASIAYNVGTIVSTCIPGGFCIPVNALAAVSNVIGYDIVLHYDNTKVRPVLTGTVVVPDKSQSALINPSYVEFQTSLDSVNGNIIISEYLNGTGGTPTFNGTGKLFCVSFTTKAAFASVDTAVFSVTSLVESYYTSTSLKQVSDGKYITYKDNLFNGKLDFWNLNGPLAYNNVDPSQYLITKIYGNNSQAYPAVCNSNRSAFVTPDLNGKFVYNTDNGTGIKIERDVTVMSVTPVINSQDALLTRQLLTDVLPSPSVYQVMAMDVNLDGKVTAGDVSQINQRNVTAISEYKQVYTYDNSGNPIPGRGPSKDWTFIDSVKATTYGTFPVGYNKNLVPVVDTCIAVPVLDYLNCPYYANVPTYKGILLGDVDGNFATVGSGGTFKIGSNDKVIFDMSKATVSGSYLDVPVSVASYDDVRAMDFALQFDESKLAFHSVIENSSSASMVSLSNYNVNDKTLRFATSSLENFEKNKALVTVRFTMLSSKAGAPDITLDAAYLNGTRVKIATIAAVNMDVNVYPNPANGTLYVESPEQVKVQLFDMQGREVIESAIVNAYEKHAINIQDIASGVYMMKLSNNSSVTTKKVLINK